MSGARAEGGASLVWQLVASHALGPAETRDAAGLRPADVQAARLVCRHWRDAVDAATTTIEVASKHVGEMCGSRDDGPPARHALACRRLLRSLRALHTIRFFSPNPDECRPGRNEPPPHARFLHFCQLCAPLLPRRGGEVAALHVSYYCPLDAAAVVALNSTFPNLAHLEAPLPVYRREIEWTDDFAAAQDVWEPPAGSYHHSVYRAAFAHLPTGLRSLALPNVMLRSSALSLAHLTGLTALRADGLDADAAGSAAPRRLLPTSLQSLTLREDPADDTWFEGSDAGGPEEEHRLDGHWMELNDEEDAGRGEDHACPIAALAGLAAHLLGLAHLSVWRASLPAAPATAGGGLGGPPGPALPAPPLLALGGLQSLHLGRTMIADAAVGRCLSVLTALTSLRCSFSAAEALPLAFMTCLEDLSVGSMSAATCDALITRGGLPRLRRLWLLSAGVTVDSDVAGRRRDAAPRDAAAGSGNGGSGGSGGGGVATLSPPAPLRDVVVRQRARGRGLRALFELLPSSLRSLRLATFRVNPEAEAEIDLDLDLEDLDEAGAPEPLYNVLARGLVRLTGLEVLKLRPERERAAAGDVLGVLGASTSSPRALSFWAVVQALPRLRDLCVRGGATDTARTAGVLPSVCDMWVTDEALAVLGARGKLRRLELDGHHAVTAAGLEAVLVGCGLGRRSTLEVARGGGGVSVTGAVTVAGCPGIDAAAAERLRMALPP